MSRMRKRYSNGQSRQPKDGADTTRRSPVKRYADPTPERAKMLEASFKNYRRMYGVSP